MPTPVASQTLHSETWVPSQLYPIQAVSPGQVTYRFCASLALSMKWGQDLTSWLIVINGKKTICESINVKNPESHEHLITHHLELFLYFIYIFLSLS